MATEYRSWMDDRGVARAGRGSQRGTMGEPTRMGVGISWRGWLGVAALALAGCGQPTEGVLERALGNSCLEAEVVNVTEQAWNATSWFSINGEGDMAGNYCAQDSPCAGWDSVVGGAVFHAQTGRITTFAAPEGYNVVQRAGLNESGMVVGTAVDGNGAGGIARAAAFRYQDGQSTLIPDPVGTGYWAATAISPSGTIAGYSADPKVAGGRIGWTLDAQGALRTFRVEGARRTFPFDINNRGDVTGYFITFDGYYGGFVLSKEGQMTLLTDVEQPPYAFIMPYGLDNRGTLVGEYVEFDAEFNPIGEGAFIWPAGGEMSQVSLPGYGPTAFSGLNEAGTIAGTTNGYADGLRVKRRPCK